MKTPRLTSLAAALGSLLLISSAAAQPDPENTAPEKTTRDFGFLGHTYLAMDASLIKYHNSPDAPTGYGSNLNINIETTDNFDIGFGYDFNHAKNYHWFTTDHIGRLWTTGFYKFDKLAPYATTGFGYGWKHNRQYGANALNNTFHRALYDFGTGVEIPVFDQVSVRVGVNYEAALRSPHPTDWTYQAAFDYKIDETLGFDTGINFKDVSRGARDAFVYHAGIRFLFD